MRIAVEQGTPGAKAELDSESGKTEPTSAPTATTRARRGHRITTACIVCGATFEVRPSWLRHGYGKTCSDACRTTWRLQRGRGRDGQPWEQVAEQLRAMGPSALAALKPPAPEIVRRFYGLVDGTPWTQLAIAEHLGLSKHRVQSILTSAPVRRLLGEPVHHKTVVVACAICGAAVERTPQQLRDRAQTTCSPACRQEFRRRQAPRLVADATTRARRLEHLRQKTSSPEFAAKSRETALHRARPLAETLRALPQEAFDALPVQERDLLRRCYGLDGHPPRTLNELAREGRIGTPRVRQLVTQALARALHHVGHPAAPPLSAAPDRPTACTDHPCDGCGICRRGLCCRGDNPTRQVHLGDWDGPIYGELGVLEADGDRVACHACGGWYVQLGVHAARAHGLKAEIYKVIFGLNVTTGLAGGRYRERMRPHARRFLSPYWPLGPQLLAAITPEQRQALDHSRRLEARKNPRNRAAWAIGARRGAQKVRELRLAGQWQSPMVRHPELVERMRQRMLRKVADPAYRAALIRQLSRGAREAAELVERTCVVCGKPFQIPAYRVRLGEGKTCSPACYRTRRAQVLQQHRPATATPEAWREWARLSVRAQWRQSRRYQRIAAALRALEPAALAGLGEWDQRMLGWYYGLDGAEVLDYSQIAARLDLSRQVVKERLHRVLAHLLGGEVVHVAGDRGGTTPDRCPVCRGVRDQRRSRGRAGTGPVPEPGAP